MSRYRGPRIRILRRLDKDEPLRGLTRKRTARGTTAGEHGKKRQDPPIPQTRPKRKTPKQKSPKRKKPNRRKKPLSRATRKKPVYRQTRRKPFFRKRRKKPLHRRIRRKANKYQIRLQEKQKLRFYYGVTESQLVNYVRQAKKSKGSTGETLLKLLEMRLDNVVHRLNFGPTIPAARQLISHGHVLINSKRVTIPSYQCQPHDTVSIAQKQHVRKMVSNVLRSSFRLFRSSFRRSPHLLVNKRRLLGKVKKIVSRKRVGLKIKELLVVEHYSRKV